MASLKPTPDTWEGAQEGAPEGTLGGAPSRPSDGATSLAATVTYLGTVLLYAGVVLRGLAWYVSSPELPAFVALAGGYGLLLISEQRLGLRFRSESRVTWPRWLIGYVYGYLAAQSILAVALLVLPPGADFFAQLFIPLCMQAVLWLGNRKGFIGIGVFVVMMTGPLLVGWNDLPSSVPLVVLYGGMCFLIGGYAHITQQARVAGQENLRLLREVQAANRQLREYATQAEDLAIAQERNRMARDLHDSVTQTLFSMNLAAQSARLLLVKDAGRAGEQVDRVQDLAQGALREIQSLVAQLRPRSIVEDGLATALQRHVAEREARDGLRVELEVISDKMLPEVVTIGLYRIVQEALNNVLKHAGTQQATLRLDLGSTPAWVEVEDRGAGFGAGAAAGEPASRLSQHVGLSAMAERAREVGWQLRVESRPGWGTRVRVTECVAEAERPSENRTQKELKA